MEEKEAPVIITSLSSFFFFFFGSVTGGGGRHKSSPLSSSLPLPLLLLPFPTGLFEPSGVTNLQFKKKRDIHVVFQSCTFRAEFFFFFALEHVHVKKSRRVPRRTKKEEREKETIFLLELPLTCTLSFLPTFHRGWPKKNTFLKKNYFRKCKSSRREYS